MHIINKRNVTLAIISLLILFVVALLIGNFTYSYVGADVSDDVINQGETTATGDTIIFSSGNKLSLHATTDNFNATSGNLTDTTNPSVRLVASSKTNNANATYYAGIRILENSYTYSTTEQTAEVILTVRDETGAIVTASSDTLPYVTVDGVSGFDITGKTGAFNIVIEHPINTTSSTTGTTHTWEFTLTFVNLETDQSINENANLDMDVVLQNKSVEFSLADVCSSGENFAECIKTFYENYGEGLANLYYHDGVGTYTNASEEAGDNSYRYSGANPNNYVCFGSDEATCPDDNLYRIIGVFNDQVKLIKADYASESSLGVPASAVVGTGSYYKGSLDSIPQYYWGGVATNNSNSWSNSSLNIDVLNGTYLTSLGAEWTDRISSFDWQVGGMIYSTGSTAKNFYDVELNSGVVYNAKVALMYVSDYGYAASPENWTTVLYSADNDTNRNNNWLQLGASEWILSPHNNTTDNAFYLFAGGSILYAPTNSLFAVRPTFYLNSNIAYMGGIGVLDDPYRVS